MQLMFSKTWDVWKMNEWMNEDKYKQTIVFCFFTFLIALSIYVTLDHRTSHK